MIKLNKINTEPAGNTMDNNELNELDDLDLDSSEDYEQANNLFAKLK